MPPSRYPQATWKGDGRSGGSYTSGPWKVVLHTTETRTIPGYRNGYSAPHLTYFPANRSWTQHTSLLTAARAMVNGPDPVQTNRDQALQVEIVCYSAKSIGDSVGGLWVGNLTAAHLADIREFLDWAVAEFGVELKWPGRQAYSYAQANAPGFRMTPADWNSWGGICGHQHVPDGNTHWDPGALDWAALLGEETELTIKRGDKGEHVRIVQQCIQAWDPTQLPQFGADADFGGETETAVKAFQAAHDMTQTGEVDGVTMGLLATFKSESATPVDAYTKAQSDARFQPKDKVPAHGHAYAPKDHAHTIPAHGHNYAAKAHAHTGTVTEQTTVEVT